MSITFQPKDYFEERVSCECMRLWSDCDELLEGHDDCQGHTVVGEHVPELNISNSGAVRLFELLNLHADTSKVESVLGNLDCIESGLLNPVDVLVSINYARAANLSEFTRSKNISILEGGAKYIDLGLKEDQLSRYLDTLAEVAHFALEKDTLIQYT